ncbi:MAG: hypothetical protein M1834_005157 [Cirrosporium novae-zelandiae]|nr:MAG: hypothetical protein M1834_005157 [Cirrosporium novae-zelandiae]
MAEGHHTPELDVHISQRDDKNKTDLIVNNQTSKSEVATKTSSEDNEGQKTNILITGETKRPKRPRKSNYNKIHCYPLPIKTYPIPPLIPTNPLSIISIAITCLIQYFFPPSSHLNTLYLGSFSTETHSIHVTDPATMRALWEMGFFGKGSLSRSEPSWLDQEKKRRGLVAGDTSEEATRRRREERKAFKEERARAERKMIENELMREGRLEAAVKDDKIVVNASAGSTKEINVLEDREGLVGTSKPNGTVPSLRHGGAASTENVQPNELKSVRFLELSISESARAASSTAAATTIQDCENLLSDKFEADPSAILNKEHLQLSCEESLFLTYGLGVLSIIDPATSLPIPTSSLLPLFRCYSYFPARPVNSLHPDDPFMLSYVVYHHFRSLGWVVRSGVKFATDYLLYNRGPAFTHAEFAVIVLPSYEDRYWTETEVGRREVEQSTLNKKNWWWLHCINRVQAQVKKTLVVAYVEVPPPNAAFDCMENVENIGRVLQRYKVREVIIKRWVPSRNLKSG